MFRKKGLWQGLTFVFAFLLAVSILIANILETYRTAVDAVTGTLSSVMVSSDDGTLYSSFKPTDDVLNEDGTGNSRALIKKAIDLGRRQSAEGSVLLKNNGALPLEKGSDVTLLGLRSHVPLLGSGMGVAIKGPYITLETALSGTKTGFSGINNYEYSELNVYGRDDGAGAGFKVNPTMVSVYESFNRNTAHRTVTDSPSRRNYNPQEPSLNDLSAINSSYQSSFATYGDAAIVVVGRPNGENTDFTPGKNGGVAEGLGVTSPLQLTDNEKAAIKLATDNFTNVIVLINTNCAMEIDELKRDEKVDAILWIGHPGNYGMLGVADILCGRVSPSGGLYDIYSSDTMSAPAMMNMGSYTFANEEIVSRADSNHYLIEAEGIYVGYRYYETRYYDSIVNPSSNAASSAGVYASKNNIWNYSDEVTYGFGYGLTYSDNLKYELIGNPVFDIQSHEIYADFTVKVTNNGSVPTKANVQIYGQAPYIKGGVEKPAVQLLNYGKTEIIPAGGNATVTVTCDLQNIASYDSEFANANGTKGTYILDEGDYYFAIGNGAHDALNNILAKQNKKVADGMDYDGNASLTYVWKYDYAGKGKVDYTTFGVSKNRVQVSNQLDYADWNSFEGASKVIYLSRADWQATYPKEYLNMVIPSSMKDLLNGQYYKVKNDQQVKVKWDDNGTEWQFFQLALADFDDYRWEEMLSQMSLKEGMVLAGYGGDSLPAVGSIGFNEIPACENAGNGFVYTLAATKDPQAPWAIGANDENASWSGQVFASAPVIASAFNPELVYEEGEFIGIEGLFFGVPILWGPGLNTHRHAYNGRNGEYYSEDPVLSGVTAMEFAMGARDMGLIAAPKHFAFNDQETHRGGIAPYMTEQRAREVELRAFQIAIEATKYDKLRNTDTGMIGLMTSYSKIGPVECTCSHGLLTDILIEEWGYHGYTVTDLGDDADLYYAAVYAGITGYDMRGKSNINYEMLQKENQLDGKAITANRIASDNDIQEAIRNSNKRMLWTIAQSNVMNRYNSSTHIESRMTWWRAAYISALVITGVFTVAALSLYAVSVVKGRKNKKEGA